MSVKWLVCVLTLFLANVSAQIDENNIETGQWYVAGAFGMGVATNPLNGGDDFPLLVIPDIAYYGQKFYFDNGQLGYTFIDKPQHALSVISELNPENRFFVFWHPTNIFNGGGAFSEPIVADKVGIEDVKKPNWALDAGINYQYFAPWGGLSLSLKQDISGVYKGHWGEVEVNFQHQFDHALLRFALGAQVNSDKLNHYYYGIDYSDELGFEVNMPSSVQPYAKMQIELPLTKDKQWIINVSYRDFSDLTVSPLFKENHTVNIFTGLKYAF